MIELVEAQKDEVNLLYILFGEDDFSRHQALADIKAALGAGDLLSANTVTMVGKHLSLAQLTANCDTVPFLSPQRLMIIEGLLECFEPNYKPERPFEATALIDYVKIMPNTTVMVLVDGKVDPRNPLLQGLSPLAKVKSFPSLKGDSLKTWIRNRVTQSGGKISEGACSLLAEFVGDDLWTLNYEIDKLMLYSQGQMIQESDVRAIVSHVRESSIFLLVDAVLEGRAAEAARVLHSLLEEGKQPPYFLVMLTRQLRLALQAKELDSQGIPASQIQGQLGVNPYALGKALAQGRKHSHQRLEKAYRQLLESDLSIKSGKCDAETALDLLVVELSR